MSRVLFPIISSRFLCRIASPLGLVVILGAGGSLGYAQGTGDYLNFETPSHRPLEVLTLDGKQYLLACNASDNALEVYTATAPPAFLRRVPTGLEPITVVVKPTPDETSATRYVYTANWLGDSISRMEFTSTGPLALDLEITSIRTRQVGDEPTGVAFIPETDAAWTQSGSPAHEGMVVTFDARGNWGLFDPVTLVPWQDAALEYLDQVELMDSSREYAIKAPRALAFDPSVNSSPKLAILNSRGGNSARYDFDLWVSEDIVASLDLSSMTSTEPAYGGLGSTNFDMRYATNGDLFVVGTLARNNDSLLGATEAERGVAVAEPIFKNMATSQTGFVTSHLWRVRDLASMPETLDLNLSSGGQPASPAIAQPTGLLIYGNGEVGQTRIFVAGFGSDTVGVVELVEDGSGSKMVVVDRLGLAAPRAFSPTDLGGDMRGPRAFALKQAIDGGDDLLYCYNRLENSITVIDPNYSDPTMAVQGTVELREDPTPAYIKDARKFLYSTKLSAGGYVSCASCHIDGNTDFLAWNLSDGKSVSPDPSLLGTLGPNPGIKGPMVTQPLRGLANFEVEDDFTQDFLFSNRPYHWRGDRGFFEDFNGAFVALMNMPNAVSQDPPRGLPDEEMKAFRDMMFSNHYPPNPEQPWNRRYSGTMHNDEPKDENYDRVDQGSLGQLGLKLAHILPADAGFSCVHCHSLPEGSNNRITEVFDNSLVPALPFQGIETAQMKAMTLREKALVRIGEDGLLNWIPNHQSAAITGEFGMVHTGLDTTPFGSRSLFDFQGGQFTITEAQQEAITIYFREFDSGVAPLIGFSYSVTASEYQADRIVYKSALDDVEQQADEANVGVVFHAKVDGVWHGFFYDPTDRVTPYHEIVQENVQEIGNVSREGLLGFVDTGAHEENAIILYCTPLGSERRVANLEGGSAHPLQGGEPQGVTLLPCRPNTANVDVPKMSANWFVPAQLALETPPLPDGRDVRNAASILLYQASLAVHAPSFGVNSFRHEAPRRFRVMGAGIVAGARLRLTAPKTPNPVGPPSSSEDQVSFEVPLYPSWDEEGLEVVWESAVEVDTLILYQMMNGGPWSPMAVLALVNPWDPTFEEMQVNPPANLMMPQEWNWWYVEVVNDPSDPEGSTSAGSWMRLVVD